MAIRNGGIDPDRARRQTTVLGCFLAQNFVMGTVYGSFGPLLTSMQADLGVGRGMMSLGMSVSTLTLALVAAIAGGMMQRFPTRTIMLFGVACAGAAYLGLSLTSTFSLALACYALLGIGVALGAILSPLELTTRWVKEGRGKALAFVNLPVLLFSCPFVIGMVLADFGRGGVQLMLGLILIALIPVLLALVHERPAQRDEAESSAAVGAGAALSAAPIGSTAGFWLVSIGIGLMAGCGIVYVVHIVPFGISDGLPLGTATAMLSIYAGAGLLGTPLFGWLADRLGPPAALTLSAAIQAVGWSTLLLFSGPMLLLIAAVLGICCTPLVSLHGAALTALFGQANAARAMGYSYLCKLPFIFGFGPMAGALFDTGGDYRMPFLLCSGAMACATLCFFGLWFSIRHAGGSRPMPA